MKINNQNCTSVKRQNSLNSITRTALLKQIRSNPITHKLTPKPSDDVVIIKLCTHPHPKGLMEVYQKGEYKFAETSQNSQTRAYPPMPLELKETLKENMLKAVPDIYKEYVTKDIEYFLNNPLGQHGSNFYEATTAVLLEKESKASIDCENYGHPFYEEHLLPYNKIFRKKMNNDNLTHQETETLNDPKYAYWKHHLSSRWEAKEILIDTLKNHDGHIVNASAGHGFREIFELASPAEVENAIGDKKNIVISGGSNGTGVVAALNAVNPNIKGIWGTRFPDYPKFFKDPSDFDSKDLLEKAKENSGKNKNFTFELTGEAPQSPQIIGAKGGTLPMIWQTRTLDSQFDATKPSADKTFVTEIQYPQSSYAMLAHYIRQGIADGCDTIIIGHDLQKFAAKKNSEEKKKYNKEYADFLNACKEKGLKNYGNLPVGHGQTDEFKNRAFPLHTKGVLFKDNNGKACLTFFPTENRAE